MTVAAMEETGSCKKPVASALTIDRAAFLLLRVKKAFKKKKQQRKDKNALVQEALCRAAESSGSPRPPPLLRSRTLPAIVVPGLSILQAQIDARFGADGSSSRLSPRPSVAFGDSRRGSSQKVSPRVSLAPPDLDITEDGTVVLRVPGPHVVAARAYRMSLAAAPPSMPTPPPPPPPLQRLARLLSATPSQRPTAPNDDSGTRRLSWERRDTTSATGLRIGRSSSIDSLVEAVWNEPQPALCPSAPPPRPTSPLAGRRTKAHRGIAGLCRNYEDNLRKVIRNVQMEVAAEKRRIPNASSSSLRRSRSVRASLRMIGSKWKNQKSSDAMRLNQSMSDPEESKSHELYRQIIRSDELYSEYDWKNAYKDTDDLIYSEMEVKELMLKPSKKDNKQSEYEVLRCSSDRLNKIDKKEKLTDFFHRTKQKENNKDDNLFQIPISVPPKAAALLHIPVIPSGPNSDDFSNHKQFLVNGFNSQNNEFTGRGPPLGTNEQTDKRSRRGSEGDQGPTSKPFFYSPQKERKNGFWTSEQQLKVPVGVPLEASYRMGAPTPPTVPAAPPVLKMTKKQSKQAQAQLEKLAKINIHLHALFAAVEHDHLEKARTILESTDVDVNSLNADGLSPLDVAVLGNNRPLAKMLLGFGAHEGNQFKNSDALGGHLRRLSQEAESRLQEIVAGGGVGGITLSAPPPSRAQGGAPGAGAATGCAGQGADQDKQLHHWERRTKALNRMLLGWRQTRPPNLPCSPELDVTSPTSVTIRIRENMSHQHNQPIMTKYRVEWSSRADFSNLCGWREVRAALPVCTCSVTGLTRGRRYFFRAQGGNLKGWGPFNTSTPNSVLPSSWRDVEGRASRYEGRAARLERVAAAARLARGVPGPPGAPPARAPRNASTRPRRPRHAIRQLFTAASKFHKNLRRGVYLACIIYHEDKVLVTNEDFLPVIEIDETYPACIYTDYHWLMKVACAWEDVKSLRADMEKNASSAIHFRTKLLAAAAQMQSALCIQDLGQLYHKPLRDSHGTLVISCINSVKSPKSVSVLNSRWLPLNKVHKKLTVLSEDNTIGDLLMGTIPEQINYHQLSSVKLPRGLYLGYLKLQSSVDLIQIVVPSKAPNVLPHCKMRDNSHVSAEEWDYLKQQQNKSVTEHLSKSARRMSITSIQSQSPTESQQMFLDLVISTAKKLFKYMDIPLENALTHRVYDLEIIDLSSDVSFIVICPPAEQACSVPGQREILLQRGDLLSLPIQAFEMIHLNTYQNSIINKYSKLSCILELDTVLANHSHREAFSNSELQTAKDRLAKLQELQNNLNSVWKDSRWLMDVISFARDKDKLQGGTGNNNIGIQMKNLISRIPTTTISTDNNPVVDNLMVNSSSNSNLKRSLLQIPPRDPKLAKSSPGRGSWPGPNATSPLTPSGGNLLSTEFSKSEQQLCIIPREESISTLNLSGSQYLSATSEMLSVEPYSRKSSADSQYTHSSIVSSNFFPVTKEIEPTPFEETPISNCLPPSRSQDTLLSQPNVTTQRRKSAILNSSLSATSSPLLNVKPFYTSSMVSVHTVNTNNTSDSMHSVSSDSEEKSCPVSTSTPNKSKIRKAHKLKKHEPSISSSKSMSNVKCNSDFTDTGQENVFLKPTTYLKSTLNAIQSEPLSKNHFTNSDTSNGRTQFFLDSKQNLDECGDKAPENRTADEGAHSFSKDNPLSEKQTNYAQAKIQQQNNEASDIASSSDGSHYSSHSSLREQSLNSEPVTIKSFAPGILQVYAAYDTGLASGTSLKLHVTPRTSAREVVDLVVKQLNMAVVLKGKDGPIYTSDKLKNFCLVAVIGARERCLRDDFKPLQLQNPWRKGRLYVRQKHEVLAALEHSSKQTAFI